MGLVGNSNYGTNSGRRRGRVGVGVWAVGWGAILYGPCKKSWRLYFQIIRCLCHRGGGRKRTPTQLRARRFLRPNQSIFRIAVLPRESVRYTGRTAGAVSFCLARGGDSYLSIYRGWEIAHCVNIRLRISVSENTSRPQRLRALEPSSSPISTHRAWANPKNDIQ